jgi:uncharacterized ferritin-like protein (DUF455 family)
MQTPTQFGSVLFEPNAKSKIDIFEKYGEFYLNQPEMFTVPDICARDVQILKASHLPDKPGISTIEGQGRLVHDLASIELQAMELAIRSLIEFPQAPKKFREELYAIAVSEARHFKLCLDYLDKIQQPWGTWPAHCGLWLTVSPEDSLLDRILIVHRYLEGSGLDAGETFLKKLSSVKAPELKELLTIISNEEVEHVQFGSNWYNQICREQNLDPETDFAQRLNKLIERLPRRKEKISSELRLRAGFTEHEISELIKFRDQKN